VLRWLSPLIKDESGKPVLSGVEGMNAEKRQISAFRFHNSAL
jgi:hypothetical protein